MVLDGIRDILGEAFYQTDGCLIYNMDCLQALRKLPDYLVWLTVLTNSCGVPMSYLSPFTMQAYSPSCRMRVSIASRSWNSPPAPACGGLGGRDVPPAGATQTASLLLRLCISSKNARNFLKLTKL